jgi:hypothetical protein
LTGLSSFLSVATRLTPKAYEPGLRSTAKLVAVTEWDEVCADVLRSRLSTPAAKRRALNVPIPTPISTTAPFAAHEN